MKNFNLKKPRQSNIELLRIVSMLMIILWHINIGFGGDKDLYVFSLGNQINAFTVVGVNCFVLISGFFGIKFKSKTFINLLLQCLFYSFIISLFCHVLFGSHIDFKMTFLPISSNVWWFMTVYVMLYLSAPLLNKALDNMTFKELLNVLLSLVIINIWFGYCFKNDNNPSGHSYLQFVLMYAIGKFIAYCKKNTKIDLIPRLCKILLNNSGGAFLVFIILTFVNMFILKSYRYNNPIVICSTLCLFLTFLNLKIRNYLQINQISATVLVAYLIHEHPLIRPLLSETVKIIHQKNSTINELVIYLVIAISFLLLGFIVEKIRRIIMNPFTNYIFNLFNKSSLKK